jgi:thioesterase domain-containing protein
MIALLPPPETLRLRLVNEASGAYRPEPFPGRIHFFEALTPPFRIRTAKPPPADRRWRELALGGVTVHRIAGDHLEIVKDPLAATTALEIEAAISGPRGGAPNRLRKTERAH